MATREDVLTALRMVKGPDLTGNIVDLGLVSEVVVANAKAIFAITVPADRAEELAPLREAAERKVLEIDGIDQVNAVLTAQRKDGADTARQGASPASARPPGAAPEQSAAGPAGIPGVKHIIAVASGKGGVGKSTTAVNLAMALKARGLSIGIMDADIYGPSMPRLLGAVGRPRQIQPRLIQPLEAYGAKVMSMGFLVAEDTPMIWRGPMVMSAITQMLREVLWGNLDVLVVDMPPGTGDAQLTMAQQVPLSGAVIVSTPQDLALIDARKGLAMFEKTNVPVLGIVENMSYYLCPSCGDRAEIFGNGGAQREAAKLGVPFLGEIPLHMTIRERSDHGQPIVALDPASPLSAVYSGIAEQVMAGLEAGTASTAGPKIVFE
ncbi:MAG: iron-sulfur cluster carrier protein ApbC [Pseudomonadota bacterium]